MTVTAAGREARHRFGHGAHAREADRESQHGRDTHPPTRSPLRRMTTTWMNRSTTRSSGPLIALRTEPREPSRLSGPVSATSSSRMTTDPRHVVRELSIRGHFGTSTGRTRPTRSATSATVARGYRARTAGYPTSTVVISSRCLRAVTSVPIVIATAREMETEMVPRAAMPCGHYVRQPSRSISSGPLARRAPAFALQNGGFDRNRCRDLTRHDQTRAALQWRRASAEPQVVDLLGTWPGTRPKVRPRRECCSPRSWRQPSGGGDKTVTSTSPGCAQLRSIRRAATSLSPHGSGLRPELVAPED